ncbi:MAG: hypothetical protein FWF82_01070 [Oscillospiraceae bacterium]|nr:hypothetical protein [Oscillospiraceae bacterium]
MTLEEFKAFKRSLANPAVKYKRGEISGDQLYKEMFVVLGKDTFDETEHLIDEADKK